MNNGIIHLIMLELRNVSFFVNREDHEKYIVNGINFTAQPNEIIAITGPNGSGKSTLAKLIAGIEKHSKGKIIYKNTDISSKSITERAKLGISIAMQQPTVFDGIKVRDLLQIALTGEEALVESSDDRMNTFLEKVGLEPSKYLDRNIDSSLSGGELKRIEIATVLAKNTQLMILDEPESGMDIWSFDHLVSLLKTVHKTEKNLSIIIISHQKKILEIADKVILMKNGKIELIGKPKDVLSTL